MDSVKRTSVAWQKRYVVEDVLSVFPDVSNRRLREGLMWLFGSSLNNVALAEIRLGLNIKRPGTRLAKTV